MNPVVFFSATSVIVLVIAIGISYYFYHKNQISIQAVTKNFTSQVSSLSQEVKNHKNIFQPESDTLETYKLSSSIIDSSDINNSKSITTVSLYASDSITANNNLYVNNSITANTIVTKTSGCVNNPYILASLTAGGAKPLNWTSAGWGAFKYENGKFYASVTGLYVTIGIGNNSSFAGVQNPGEEVYFPYPGYDGVAVGWLVASAFT